MSVMLTAPGIPMSIGHGKLALWRQLRDASAFSPTSPIQGGPAGIDGLWGWWDAATPNFLIGPDGQPAAGWNVSTASIAPMAGTAPALASFSAASTNVFPVGVPHLSGLLGGVGRATLTTGCLDPCLHPDLGFQLPSAAIGSGADWTIFLVWSRPNRRQGSGRDNAPVPLLAIGGITILQADSLGNAGALTLFPGIGQTILATSLTRRHTHSVVLRYHQSTGVDVWLDDTQVVNASHNLLPAIATSPLLFLHDGTAQGAAQCWFHEAAVWTRALSESEIGSMLVYSGRWCRGSRKGFILLINGQSNAINFALNDGAASALAEGVRWHLGALACNILAVTGSQSRYTMQSGHGLYPVANSGYPGSFLNNPNDDSTPSTWLLGADGLALQQVISSMSSEDLTEISAVIWPWNETDSLRDYTEGATFNAAVRRFLFLERQMVGKSPDQLPLILWNAIPYGTTGGMQMHRETVAALAADPSQNVIVGNHQTSDSNARGSVWDSMTGAATGGDFAHRDSLDNQRFARVAAALVGRAILASTGGDSIRTIPSAVPNSGGPAVVHAYRASDASIILKIQHDGGNDLKIPLQAANGIGFTVIDGGSTGVPGMLVSATACHRIDATHLQITLAQPLQHESASCRLYYPFGSTVIGRGNAVTDNYATTAKPDNWDIAKDLGTAWALDYPLAATFLPIPLSDTAD